MLNAIGIYDKDFARLTAAPSSTARFFSKNDAPLQYLEQTSLSILTSLQANEIYSDYVAKEYHYIKKLPDQTFIGIVAKKSLDTKELSYLFINIQQIGLRATGGSLDAIIANPLRYIAKDFRIKEIQENIEKTKIIMGKNIQSMVNSVEKVEVLQDKTVQLQQEASVFKKKSKRSCGNCN